MELAGTLETSDVRFAAVNEACFVASIKLVFEGGKPIGEQTG